MIRSLLIAMFALIASAQVSAFAQSCPPPGYDRDALLALRADRLQFPNDRARNAFARELTACVGDPDPAIRDGIAYEAFHYFSREGLLTPATMRAVEADLRARLAAPEGEGFERPFAALVLSDVVAADVAVPFLTSETRAELLRASIDYFTQVRDYRGFVDGEGWRHGVAHGADLLMQLSKEPDFGRDELTRIRAALVTQIAPAGHAYIHGESERLAVAMLFVARRGVFTEAEWSAWVAEIADPGALGAWGEAFKSEAGLAKLHDTRAFLMALNAHASLNANADDDVLLPGVRGVLQTMQ